ncbi:hypothetical protein P691DRAFT_299049 [Macrolepiota fuliginosa MF-IS2]|uniref:Uncharacterized protein n=1 Tax=Macrolepiota fuliginosa MF-IS2 TaxID=1400762 RepID=A0A9P5X8V8_9AGAR|nr:hypothetical protein P691DRAFT_299049 [Macrolepiota fuliginosa MF-IS2]
MRAATFPSIVSRTDWKVFKLWKAVEGVKNQEPGVREDVCVDAPDAHDDIVTGFTLGWGERDSFKATTAAHTEL